MESFKLDVLGLFQLLITLWDFSMTALPASSIIMMDVFDTKNILDLTFCTVAIIAGLTNNLTIFHGLLQ